MSDRIRAERRARGWSQTELARRSGLTRQLVSAVEAGRQTPGVTAALALAGSLGTSVEQLFGSLPDQALDVLAQPVAPGTPVVTGRVGEEVVSASHPYGAGGDRGARAADGVWSDGSITWLPGASPASLVLAGCDPVLGPLSDLVERAGHRVLDVHASTGRSLEALAAGRVHGALVHGRPGDLPDPPVRVRRWRVSHWQVGLVFDAARPVSLDELVERGATVVQRDPGAGAQRALLRALDGAGSAASLPGPRADGHLDVARRVSYGCGEAGVAMEAAAHALGLGFTPLETHAVELWVAEPWSTLPSVVRLLEVLGSEALVRRARLLGGYDPSGCGAELLAG